MYMSIKLNIYLYWHFQQNKCLNIQKHTVHNIHRLAWAPMLVGPTGNYPVYQCAKTELALFSFHKEMDYKTTQKQMNTLKINCICNYFNYLK